MASTKTHSTHLPNKRLRKEIKLNVADEREAQRNYVKLARDFRRADMDVEARRITAIRKQEARHEDELDSILSES